MGSYRWSEKHKEVTKTFKERAVEKDRLYPRIERPCGTPGAVYTIMVDGNDLGCLVRLPFDIESAIPETAKEEMKKELHDALLPIVERFYRKVWDKTIAGKKLADDPEPMPKRWELLFTKWLDRCFDRGEFVRIEGQEILNKYMLPERYRWW